MTHAFYAIGLNFHQPYNNLVELLNTQQWEAKQLIQAYARPPRYVEQNRPEARLHVAFSGTLLMQLSDPGVRTTFEYDYDTQWLLQQYRSSEIEFLGSGYTHPVFPLIPQKDWETQIGRYLEIARPALGRGWFPGFWPPEMGFCMEMIPYLKRFGYRYVVVDHEHIEPISDMSWGRLRYRPHIARYGGAEIIVVPRDREISNAQQSGFDPGWFAYELGERTKFCDDFPPLVVSWTDGDNGGWFRNLNENSGFWGWFYQPMLQWQRSGTLALSQISINEYLDRFGADGEVCVHRGAWNTGHHDGRNFVQWTGSLLQKQGLAEIDRVSERYHNRRWQLSEQHAGDEQHHILDRAYWHILRAETSCNFFWGSRWVYRAFDDLEEAERLIASV
ncbi:MAG: glycoside hydrolase family 57 [Deltaproteobacteria bacterium]|nr:glycoside hydrolase family 57 [Deltaproteobacteria bacterium]